MHILHLNFHLCEFLLYKKKVLNKILCGQYNKKSYILFSVITFSILWLNKIVV